MIRRLNFGSGSVQPDGWLNADQDETTGATVVNVFHGLPWEDDSFDGIVANHVVQQIPWWLVVDAFTELRRVLRPGGVLRVMVPDILGAFAAFRRGDDAWFPNRADSLDETFCAYLTWFSTNTTPMTGLLLGRRLREAGFARIAAVEHGASKYGRAWITELDDRAGESIFMEAEK